MLIIPRNNLGDRSDIEFGLNVLTVPVDGKRGNAKLVCYLLALLPSRYVLQDLFLTSCKLCVHLRLTYNTFMAAFSTKRTADLLEMEEPVLVDIKVHIVKLTNVAAKEPGDDLKLEHPSVWLAHGV